MNPTPEPEATAPPGPPPGVRTMAVVRWVIVALAAALAVFAVVSYSGAARRAGPTGGQLYYCPMHPSVVQDHPGECPICSMTLVPKPAGKPGHAAMDAGGPVVPGLAGVDLSPERIQLIGMKTAPVKRGTVGGELRAAGVVAPSERGLAQITTRFGGWVEKVMVSASGERVRRGQVLATIYSPEVHKAEQDLLITRGWTDKATPPRGGAEHEGMTDSLGESARQRLILLGVSAADIEEVLRSGKAATAIAIRSPADGHVIAKNVVVGAAIQPGTVLFDVADLSTVWIQTDVPEQDLGRVAVGQAARLELPSQPGQPVSGRVQFVSPVLDAQNRTLRVRLEFKNRIDKSGPRLRPGMYGTVYLALPPTTGLMVPAEAVVDSGELHYLFVARPGGHFEPRKVQVGGHAADQVEILSGVREGETVVTTGNFLIDSESRLRAAIEGQSSAAANAPGGLDECARQFDGERFPDKVQACRACEVQHRGMGTMVDDCKNAIARPWR